MDLFENLDELKMYIEDLAEKVDNFYDEEGFFSEEKVYDLLATCHNILLVTQGVFLGGTK